VRSRALLQAKWRGAEFGTRTPPDGAGVRWRPRATRNRARLLSVANAARAKLTQRRSTPTESE
jgi:hypothetical protein